MTKITGRTTLAELAVMRGKLGVTRIALDFSYNDETIDRVRALVFGPQRTLVVIGTGETEIAALDDAFARLWHLEAEQIAKVVTP